MLTGRGLCPAAALPACLPARERLRCCTHLQHVRHGALSARPLAHSTAAAASRALAPMAAAPMAAPLPLPWAQGCSTSARHSCGPTPYPPPFSPCNAMQALLARSCGTRASSTTPRRASLRGARSGSRSTPTMARCPRSMRPQSQPCKVGRTYEAARCLPVSEPTGLFDWPMAMMPQCASQRSHVPSFLRVLEQGVCPHACACGACFRPWRAVLWAQPSQHLPHARGRLLGQRGARPCHMRQAVRRESQARGARHPEASRKLWIVCQGLVRPRERRGASLVRDCLHAGRAARYCTKVHGLTGISVVGGWQSPSQFAGGGHSVLCLKPTYI